MDWENEPWVKVYTRETDDDIALSWEARALWDALMKRFDQSGVLASKRGIRGVVAASRMPADVVERVLPELLTDGRLREVDGAFVAPNFVDAQRARKSDPQRKRESRARRRADALGQSVTIRDQEPDGPTGQSVTNSADPVTFRDRDPASVTKPDVSVTNRDFWSPREEREETDERVSARAPAIPPSTEQAQEHETAPESPAAPKPIRNDDPNDPARVVRRELASRIWLQLELIRSRFAKQFGAKLRPLHPADQGLRELSIRIREIQETGAGIDRAEADCQHVLKCAELEAWGSTPPSAQWLHGGIFEERSWRRKLGMSLDDAARAPRSPVSSPTQLRIVRATADEDEMPPLPAGMRE